MSKIADISTGRTRLRVTGADCVDLLHGQCTNDIKKLRAGESCYAAFLNAKGKMRGDAHIVCRPEEFLLDASAGLQASLEKFVITEDVVIEDVSALLGAWLVIGVAGETARPAVSPYRGSEVALPAGAVTFSHPLGLGVLSPVPLPVTLDTTTLDALRIEAGIPAWGVDMDEETIPVEAGLGARAISYDKGCYIGQETIARIKTYGHVNRHLVQLSVNSEKLPVRGEQVMSGDKPVGHVTSAAYSNRLGKTLALGYVRREFAVRGVTLTAGQQPAEVLKICGE